MEKKILSTLSSRKGQVLQSVAVLALVVMAGGFIGTLTVQQSRLAKKKRQDIEFGIQVQAGIETMLLAYRTEEIRYIDALSVAKCESAKPFLQALKEGSACTGGTMGDFKVFDNATLDPNLKPLFNYAKASGPVCTIKVASSNCAQSMLELAHIGIEDPTQKVMGTSYKFFLNAIMPEKSIAEFVVQTMIEGGNFDLKRSFAIRPILPNSAHHDSDGKVVQETPDPLARCPGASFAVFNFFNPESQNCERFVELGGGTGLAYYGGRYFGFRPADGQVIDMFASSTNKPSYLVGEDGKLGAETVFPAYNKSDFINVDDITAVDDQLYYVRFLGTSAELGLLDLSASPTHMVQICPLGQLGWAQSYSGIAALSWSDKLNPPSANKKLAIFFLKTDGGDLLTAAVSSSTTYPAATISGVDFPKNYRCTVFKDQNLQAVEYKRTLGFDRTADSKPYFIY